MMVWLVIQKDLSKVESLEVGYSYLNTEIPVGKEEVSPFKLISQVQQGTEKNKSKRV